MTSFAFDLPAAVRGEDPAILVTGIFAQPDGEPYDFTGDTFEMPIGLRRSDDADVDALTTLTSADSEIAWGDATTASGDTGTQFTFRISAEKIALLTPAASYIADLFRTSGGDRTRFAEVTLPVKGAVSA